MDEILCCIDMSVMDQDVYQGKNYLYSAATADLYELIPQTCHQKNINKIHLFGNTKYLEGMVANINANEVLTYGKNNLEIKIN